MHTSVNDQSWGYYHQLDLPFRPIWNPVKVRGLRVSSRSGKRVGEIRRRTNLNGSAASLVLFTVYQIFALSILSQQIDTRWLLDCFSPLGEARGFVPKMNACV